MHDPAHPAGPSGDPAHGSSDATADDAFTAVTRVIAWYTQQILAERRSAAPDQGRLEQLLERQRACVADRNRLAGAGPEETARIAADYEARVKKLSES
ncbi:hypothetical protein [Streptomyces sp. NPDC021096]|uniref:hypothetical protein n=1 Tax=Streptomyces sp. NPDC021096 TaxID=3154792 RepID=UPI0033E5CC3F